jgi:mono/diheme cytochrome c family protein
MPVRTTTKVIVVSLVAGVLGMAPAIAQPKLKAGDADKGRLIAERLCASCHSLTGEPKPNATTSSDILSFPAIARQPKATAEYLAGRIIIPHPAMPDISLNIAEIRDVIAYITSLQTAPGK